MTSTVASASSSARFGSLCILCSTARNLFCARAEHLQSGCSPEDVAFLGAPLRAAAQSAKELLAANPELAAQNAQVILSSLYGPLIELLPIAQPGTMHVTSSVWERLIRYCSPEDIAQMASRGLGVGPYVAHYFDILSAETGESGRAGEMADAIAKHIGAFERARGPGDVNIWTDTQVREITSPLFAPYLRAQVASFPEDAEEAILYTSAEGDLATLLRFYAAGLPAETIASSIPLKGLRHKEIAKVSEMLGSNHGNLEIRRRTGSLEELLVDSGKAIAAFST